MLHRYNEITQWGHDKCIYTESDAIHQLNKFDEEFTELCLAYATNNTEDLIDAIGDCVVCLVHVANFSESKLSLKSLFVREMTFGELYAEIAECLMNIYTDYRELDFTLNEEDAGHLIDCLARFAKYEQINFDACIEKAWKTIEHRPGKMIAGKFVKDAE